MKITLAVIVLTLAALAVNARAEETKKAAPAKAPKARKAAKAMKNSLHEKFAALDLNHDGVLDASELAAYEKKVVETKGKDGKALDEKTAAEDRASLEAEFKKEDASHDGKVTEAEFSAEDAPAAK